MIESILLTSAFIYLLLASINDIKHRFVHDYLTYSFGALFLILRLILFFETSNPAQLGFILYALPTLGISFILYKLGAWGGGDLKLLTALSIGIPYFSTDSVLPFYANFLSNAVIAGMIFSILWALYLILKNLKKVSRKIKKTDVFVMLASVIISIILLFQNNLYKIFSILFLFLPVTYLAKKVENEIQTVNKKVSALEEGDWIINDIKIGGRVIKKKPTGLSKKDIMLLQKSGKKIIQIRDGIPFVPSFLIALIATVIYGNIIYNFVQNMITSI